MKSRSLAWPMVMPNLFFHRICSDRNCFYWPVGKTKGSFLVAVGTLFGWLLQSYQSVSCLFSPKPHFVYKWWLYVKTFCLSSKPVLGLSLLLDTCTLTSHTNTLQHTLLNCLVHCNMNQVFLLQSKLKPLYFSLSFGVCADDPDFVMFFWFKYCAT